MEANSVSQSDPGQRVDISHKEIASGMLQQGIITLHELVQLVSQYPNDQELGETLRLLLKDRVK